MSSLDAEGYLEALLRGLDEFGLYNRIMFVCSDGAVITGKNNGLVAKLKNRLPHLQSIHCIAHRCSLATKKLSADFPALANLNIII